MTDSLHLEAAERSPKVALAGVAVGAVAVAFGLYLDPRRTWLNLLLNGFYFLSLSVSATFFIASQLMTGARWSASLRRIPEALMLLWPVGAVPMLALFFGRRWIYEWSFDRTFAGEPGAEGRALYLKTPFFFGRMAIAIALWALFAWLFRKTSLEQDGDRRQSLLIHRRLTRYSAVFLVVFAPSFTIAVYDWVLSLDPRWFSTMFAVYAFAGMFVQGIAAVTVLVVVLRQRGYLGAEIDAVRLHDLGKLLFGFSTFWAYIWLCQYLLIWYGNVPDEVTYYVRRTNGAWLVFFALNVAINWLLPFVALMSARAKQSPRTLRAVATLLLVGHWLDLYLLIMPSKWSTPSVGVLEVAIPLGCASLSYLVVLRGLARAPLVPLNDPILAADLLRSAEGHA